MKAKSKRSKHLLTDSFSGANNTSNQNISQRRVPRLPMPFFVLGSMENEVSGPGSELASDDHFSTTQVRIAATATAFPKCSLTVPPKHRTSVLLEA
jgi:hypothetical protein